MAFSSFTVLCKCHLCLVPKHFYLSEMKPTPIKQSLPRILLPYFWATTSLLSVSVDLHVMAVTFSLCLVLSVKFLRFIHIEACVSTVFHSSLWLNNFLLYGCIYHILFIHLLMDIWIVSTFWLLWIVLQDLWLSICLNTCFWFFWFHP